MSSITIHECLRRGFGKVPDAVSFLHSQFSFKIFITKMNQILFIKIEEFNLKKKQTGIKFEQVVVVDFNIFLKTTEHDELFFVSDARMTSPSTRCILRISIMV